MLNRLTLFDLFIHCLLLQDYLAGWEYQVRCERSCSVKDPRRGFSYNKELSYRREKVFYRDVFSYFLVLHVLIWWTDLSTSVNVLVEILALKNFQKTATQIWWVTKKMISRTSKTPFTTFWTRYSWIKINSTVELAHKNGKAKTSRSTWNVFAHQN